MAVYQTQVQWSQKIPHKSSGMTSTTGQSATLDHVGELSSDALPHADARNRMHGRYTTVTLRECNCGTSVPQPSCSSPWMYCCLQPGEGAGVQGDPINESPFGGEGSGQGALPSAMESSGAHTLATWGNTYTVANCPQNNESHQDRGGDAPNFIGAMQASPWHGHEAPLMPLCRAAPLRKTPNQHQW